MAPPKMGDRTIPKGRKAVGAVGRPSATSAEMDQNPLFSSGKLMGSIPRTEANSMVGGLFAIHIPMHSDGIRLAGNAKKGRAYVRRHAGLFVHPRFVEFLVPLSSLFLGDFFPAIRERNR